MLQRYLGACNMQTDIKEACFLGAEDELVAAGSDAGYIFIWNAETGQVSADFGLGSSGCIFQEVGLQLKLIISWTTVSTCDRL